jgi:predicted glycogen debranching enzyme
VVLGPLSCADVGAGSQREWLLTDGLGGYAMGTASGLRTRRYHGLLVVSTGADGQPADPAHGVSRRHLALASLDPVLVLDGRRIRLATHEWAGGVVDPAGATLMSGLEIRPGSVVHRWAFEDVVVERELAMVHGRPATAVVHRLVRAPGPVHLEVSALGTWRDVHGERTADGGDPLMYPVDGGAVIDSAWRIQGPGFAVDGRWYRGVRYREEAARGLTDTEDLWHLGTFSADLTPGQSLQIVAWAADRQGLGVPPPAADQVVRDAAARAQGLLEQAGAATAGRARQVLVLAADRFVTTGPGVVAGYPWFGEWSRDTMTCYEGLFLATGRHDEGAGLLRRYAATVSAGMLANTADGGAPEFNTVDATPWFLHAVRRHVDATGDLGLAAQLTTTLLAVVDAHVKGTRYGIRVDPADGLLSCGGPTTVSVATAARAASSSARASSVASTPPASSSVAPDDPTIALTWMDARIDGRAVTPRHGKPVEVNALWINGLRGLRRLLDEIRASPDAVAATGLSPAKLAGASRRMHRLAATAQDSFVRRFVDGDGSRTGTAGGLLDVVDVPDASGRGAAPGRGARSGGGAVSGGGAPSDDARLRPNQLLAASLPDGPLAGDPAAVAAVVRAVAPLVTPLGLRSLGPADPGYRGRHRGSPHERDAAYHQGTVWPWLIGPYVGALRAAGLPEDGVLDGLLGHLGEAGLASVSETADGDPPHAPTGCPMQAWSVAELVRLLSQR